MDHATFRAEFSALSRLAYLNAGSNGPLAARAVAAAERELRAQLRAGRAGEHYGRMAQLRAAQRSAYADVLGCAPADVALTASTTEGIATVLAGWPLERGDEIVTSDQEHPGVLGPLQAVRDLRGVVIRVAPWHQLADAVGPATKLIVCSHVSWLSGELAPTALARATVPVVLDGAQGAGAIPVAVRALGCVAYAAAGQKWLCGPDGTGMLYVSPDARERIAVTRRPYGSYLDAARGLDAALRPDCARFDASALGAEASALAAAAAQVLAEAGWGWVHERGCALAERLAQELRRRGHQVLPRGASTLVAWRAHDSAGLRDRLTERGVIVRDLPGRGTLRASVGAWNDERDLDQLLSALED